MNNPLPMQRCSDGSVWFPSRYGCEHEEEIVFASSGRIEEITVQQSTPARTFATVRTELGPTVLARLNRDDARPGDTATLSVDPADTERGDELIAFVALKATYVAEEEHAQ